MSNKRDPRGGTDREQERRQRATAAMRAARAKEKRRSLLINGGIALAVAAIAIATTIGVLSNLDDDTVTATAPAAVTTDGAYVMGNEDAPVTVTVVEDLQCPACQAFEGANADLLESYAEGEDVAVAYRGIAFLDRASTTDYSSRALNASVCVMDQGPEVWKSFHRELYVQQPQEGGAGLSDDQLVDLAVTSGAAEDEVRPCIEDGTYRDWAAATTEQASSDGITGTPTVLIDGEVTEARTPEQIDAAVQEALAAA